MADDLPSVFGKEPATEEPTQQSGDASLPSVFAERAKPAPQSAAPPRDVSAGYTLNNEPDEGFWRGLAKNALTTINKGISHVPGSLGDVYEQMKLGEAGLRSLVPGSRGWREILNEINQQQEAKHKQGMFLPMTGEEIHEKYIKPHVGEYEPTTEWGKAGRAIGEAGIAGLALAGTGGVLPGVLGGAAAHGTSLATDNPYTQMAAAIMAGSAPAAARKVVGKIKGEQLTPQQEKQKAIEGMEAFTEDPAAAWRAMQERKAAGLPDEPTAQASLDPAQALAQDTVTSTRHPAMTRALHEERLRQQQELQKAFGQAAPIAMEPTQVSANFLKHLEALDAEQTRLSGELPKGLPGDQAGAALAENAQAAGKHFKSLLDRLKAGIDPEGVLRSDARGLRQFAHKTLTDLESRPFKDRSTIADAKFQQAKGMPEVLKFNDLVDFDQSLTAAMTEAKLKGDMAGYNQIRALKGQVKEALKKTAEEQHIVDQGEVLAGRRPQEQTVASSVQSFDQQLARSAEEWLRQKRAAAGERQPSGSVGIGPVARAGDDASQRPGTVPPLQGEAGAAGAGPDVSGRPSGLSPDDVGAAAERLREFNRGWGLYKDIYTKGEVGKALETEGVGGTRGMTNAEIANKAFASGTKGYENAMMWLRAGGTDGLARLKDVALGRMQSEIKEGKVLDQKALDAYRTKYRDALRAIDEHEPGFSRQFDNPVNALEKVRAFEKSEAGKFLGLEHPDTITAHVGTLMKARDGAERISTLMQQAAGTANPEAIVAGLRQAGRTWLEQEFRTAQRLPGEGGEAVPVFRGAALRDFIGENRNKLDALFDPKAVDAMADIASKIDRSKMVQTMQNVQHNSLTAGRLQGIEQQRRMLGQQLHAALAQDAKGHTANTFSALAAWEMLREVGKTLSGSGDVAQAAGAAGMFAIGKAWERALERAGARKAAQEHRITDLVAQGFASRDFALALREEAINEFGVPNQRAFDNLARALVGVEATQQTQQEDRARRASGGRVGELANHMIRAVDRARKMDVAKTKPLLQQDDSMVAHALAIAGKHI